MKFDAKLKTIYESSWMKYDIWVTCNNSEEFNRMEKWCAKNGIKPLGFKPEKFPINVIVDLQTKGPAAWDDSMDRAANYMSFSEFVEKLSMTPMSMKS